MGRLNGGHFRASPTAYAAVVAVMATVGGGVFAYGQMAERVDRNTRDVAQHEREIDVLREDLGTIRTTVEATRSEQKVLNAAAKEQREKIEGKLDRLLERLGSWQ